MLTKDIKFGFSIEYSFSQVIHNYDVDSFLPVSCFESDSLKNRKQYEKTLAFVLLNLVSRQCNGKHMRIRIPFRISFRKDSFLENPICESAYVSNERCVHSTSPLQKASTLTSKSDLVLWQVGVAAYH